MNQNIYPSTKPNCNLLIKTSVNTKVFQTTAAYVMKF